MHFQEEKMENLKFYVDQNAPKTKFDHYWEKCVGACHACLLYTSWESVTPEVSDLTAKKELPKAGPMTGVKS